jgi:hypothetical protein
MRLSGRFFVRLSGRFENFQKRPLGYFLFKATTPSHDDYGKTISDIEKRVFAFNCQLKKLNGEIFPFFQTTSSPVTGDLLYKHFRYKF